MAEEFNDLSFGDETRRNGDYVSLPVSSDNDVDEGDVVGIDDNGYVARADADAGIEAIGVLYTYQYYEEANAGEQIDYDRDATVKVGGTVKAWVHDGVDAGEALVADSTTDGEAGQFVTAGTQDGATANFVAIRGAAEQTGGPRNESQHVNPDRDGDHFAEVLLR